MTEPDADRVNDNLAKIALALETISVVLEEMWQAMQEDRAAEDDEDDEDDEDEDEDEDEDDDEDDDEGK
jgi:hypothetical protein